MSVDPLSDLRQACGIGDDDWSYLVVGDGSGTTWDNTCGWGSLVASKQPDRRWLVFGGFSAGTNNTAEIMPYLQALAEIWRDVEEQHRFGQIVRVHVVSDSQYVVECGKNPERRKSHSHKGWWSLLDFYQSRGIVIQWHWLERTGHIGNTLSHKVANLSRLAMADVWPAVKRPLEGEI